MKGSKAFSSGNPEKSGADYIRDKRNKTIFNHIKTDATTHNKTTDYNGTARFNSTNITQANNYDTLFSISKGKHTCDNCSHSNVFHKQAHEAVHTVLSLAGQNIVVGREIASSDIDNALDDVSSNFFIDPNGSLFNTNCDTSSYLNYVEVPTKDLSDNLVKYNFPGKITF